MKNRRTDISLGDLREAFLQVAGSRRHFSSLDIHTENFTWFSKKADTMYKALPVKKKSGNNLKDYQEKCKS